MASSPGRIAALAAAGLALAGCATAGTGSSSRGTITIGVEMPQSGAETLSGVPALNGVRFAVSRAHDIKGFGLAIDNRDDASNGSHDPQKGVDNIRALIANRSVLGVIGPINSSVARAEIPVANPDGLTLISPTNGDECLTKMHPPPECDITPASLRPSGKNNYFRVSPTDDMQGPGLANYAYDTLKLVSVAVASDNETYGKAMADNFRARFEARGGKIAARQDLDTASTASIDAFFSLAKSRGAQGIYFGGIPHNKVCTARQRMRPILPGVPFMGPDALITTACIQDAADNADNMYATVAAIEAGQIPSAISTIDAFKHQFTRPDDYGSSTMAAYDCANILIAAIGRAIDRAGGNLPSREQVRVEVGQTTHFPGILGETSFDANGDTSNTAVTVYKIGPGPGVTGASPRDWIFASLVKAS